MIVTAVPPQHIYGCYDSVKAYLRAAVERSNGRERMADLLKKIMSGENTLWMCIEDDVCYAACVTEVYEYSTCRMLRLLYASGDQMDRWLDPYLKKMEEFAIDCGCSSIEMSGRMGWKRELQKRQWIPESIVMRIDLKEAH